MSSINLWKCFAMAIAFIVGMAGNVMADDIKVRVKKGDSLWRIAKKHYDSGRYYTVIAKANGIKRPYCIHEGQWLTVPESKKNPVKKNRVMLAEKKEFAEKNAAQNVSQDSSAAKVFAERNENELQELKTPVVEKVAENPQQVNEANSLIAKPADKLPENPVKSSEGAKYWRAYGSLNALYGCNELSDCKGGEAEFKTIREPADGVTGFGAGVITQAKYTQGCILDLDSSAEITTMGLRLGPSLKYVGKRDHVDKRYQLLADLPVGLSKQKRDVVAVPFSDGRVYRSNQENVLFEPSLEWASRLDYERFAIMGVRAKGAVSLAESYSSDLEVMRKKDMTEGSIAGFVRVSASKNFESELEIKPLFYKGELGAYGAGLSLEVIWKKIVGLKFAMELYPYGIPSYLKNMGAKSGDIDTYGASLVFYLPDKYRSLR